jgi:hypothetical protein
MKRFKAARDRVIALVQQHQDYPPGRQLERAIGRGVSRAERGVLYGIAAGYTIALGDFARTELTRRTR